MIRITVYAGPSLDEDDLRGASVSVREPVDSVHVHEELRQIGLEWKQADYMPNRQVFIVLEPALDKRDAASVGRLVRDAMSKLEQTGLT